MARKHIPIVESVLSELVRHAQMGLEELKALDGTEHHCTISSSSGASYLCGRKAYEGLLELAEVVVRGANLQGKCEVEQVADIVGEKLFDRFVSEPHTVTESQVDRLFRDTTRTLNAMLVEREYVWPCHLVYRSTPTRFSIGPVEFIHRKLFRAEFLADRANRAADDNDEYSRRYRARAIRYFRAFEWVARVRVQGATENVAKQIAIQAVRYAVDFIHVFLGGEHSDQMRVAGPDFKKDEQASFYRDGESGLHWQVSSSGVGQVGPAEDWSSWFDDPNTKHLAKVYGTALGEFVQNGRSRPIAGRVLDAAAWYGDACRETNVASQVVKFVTGVERLMVTKRRADGELAAVLNERVAAICTEPGNRQDRNRWRETTKRIYQLRSDLVHGSVARTDLTFSGMSMSVSQWARECILTMVSYLRDGLEGEPVSEKEVDQWFDQHVTRVDECERRQSELEQGDSI